MKERNLSFRGREGKDKVFVKINWASGLASV